MSPTLALWCCAAFVMFALWVDRYREPRVFGANWIAVAWVCILASRPIAQWLDPSPVNFGSDAQDGSPMDRNVLSALIFFAFLVLVQRSWFRWSAWIGQNKWVFLLFLYCGLSIVWSEFPQIALKRWLRAVGSIMIILVVLSDRHPVEAIATVVRRMSFILIPFSIVLIKYYRWLSVEHNTWTGEEFLVGVTTDKNALGRLCLICAVFSIWELLWAGKEGVKKHLVGKAIQLSVLALTLWLLVASKSSTSLVSFLLACAVLVVLGFKSIRKRAGYLGTATLVIAACGAALSAAFDLPELIVGSLGRNMTLTDRAFLWADLLAWPIDPVIGVGYDSFWLGQRLDHFIKVHQVNEAHNGFLEVYLELGFIGLGLFGFFLLGLFFRAKQSLINDGAYGQLRMAMLAVFVSYNITEAGYKATTLIFFTLLLVALQIPGRTEHAVLHPEVEPGSGPEGSLGASGVLRRTPRATTPETHAHATKARTHKRSAA